MDELKEAQKDFLTGFYTRDQLISVLIKRIIDASLYKEKFSILLVDIDHFKNINDKYGHIWGDEFLKFVASTLRLTLEEKGSIFRYGGDEFVVLFSSSDPREAFSLARQFNAVTRNRPFLFNRRLFKMTISCGLATYPDDAQGAEELLKIADKALYFSKRYGRNTTTRASKIGIQKFKIISAVFLEVFFILALIFFLNNYLFRGLIQRTINKLSNIRLFSTATEIDTTVVLKSGDVIRGRIVSEDRNKVVIRLSFDQGKCTMNIEKSLIESITPMQGKSD